MMPDKALAATERQFFRLVGESNRSHNSACTRSRCRSCNVVPPRDSISIASTIPSGVASRDLDALIITGNVVGPDLSQQPFWQPLIEVTDWALCQRDIDAAAAWRRTWCWSSVTASAGCRGRKTWGVFPHRVVDRMRPTGAT